MRISDWSSDVCSSDLISRLIEQPRPFERELDVAGFLGRAASDDGDVVDDLRRKRIALVMGRCWRSARGSRRRRNPGRACFSGELLDDRPDPAFGGSLVIDIAIAARRDPFGLGRAAWRERGGPYV